VERLVFLQIEVLAICFIALDPYFYRQPTQNTRFVGGSIESLYFHPADPTFHANDGLAWYIIMEQNP
jgi:hypothetical protein